MKILIVDNNINPADRGASDLRKFALKIPGATVVVRRGPENDLPKNLEGFDRILISGSKTSILDTSEWTQKLEGLVKKVLSLRKPLLGVCYGHQIIARAIGGISSVRVGSTPEYGWTQIERTAHAPLFNGLPDRFWSFSAHREEVSVLPQGLRAFAKSDVCAIQAFEVEGHPAYGIQFHPEWDLEAGEKTLAERKKKGEPSLHPGEGKKLFDPKIGEIVYGNFFSL